MKKIIALTLILIMLLCCGCTDQSKPTESAQYVIALNPSVMLEDGTVVSLRNSAASSMQSDIKANENTALYKKTPWFWGYREDDEWCKRAVKELSLWDSSAKAAYAYKFTNDGAHSLAVYDTRGMEIKGVGGTLPASGVYLSFTGDKEEAICYTANEDCLVELSDRNGGGISVVESINGVKTAFFNSKTAKKNIVARIYVNNRMYWQEVLSAESPSVTFPEFTNIELKKGDCFLITFEAADDVKNLIKGNCDIEKPTKLVNVQVPVTTPVLVEKPVTEIALVKDATANITIVRPDDASKDTLTIIKDFQKALNKKLEIDVELIKEYDYSPAKGEFFLFVGQNDDAASKNALNEIYKTRTANAGDYIIRHSEDKIIVAAGNDHSLKFALDFFLDNYAVNEDSTIKAGHNYKSASYNKVSDIVLGGKSIKDYRVVHSPYYTYFEAQAVDYLVKSVAKMSGYLLPVVNEKTVASGNEITVGNTNRTSSDYALLSNNKAYDEYVINVGDNLTSITSTSNSSVNVGVIDFVKRLESGTLAKGKYTGAYDGNYSMTNGYKLVWSDDFDGTYLSDTWSWKSDTYGSETFRGGITHGDFKLATVENGALKIDSYIQGTDTYGTSIITSGPESMEFKYGYTEARMKFPAGNGWIAAFWGITGGGAVGTGEFDIFENAGSENRVASNLHIWASSEPDGHSNLLANSTTVANHGAPAIEIDEKWSEKYHTFGMDWTDDYINFYCDGVCYYSFDCTKLSKYDIFDQYIKLIVGYGCDVKWTGRPTSDPDGTLKSGYVDWVRVWQIDDPTYGLLDKSKK